MCFEKNLRCYGSKRASEMEEGEGWGTFAGRVLHFREGKKVERMVYLSSSCEHMA